MFLFLGILCTLLAANQCFHSIFSQKWFSWNYFMGINIMLLLFQLSLIKTKQQTPLTLIDGKGYLHFLWGQASNRPGGDQECVRCLLVTWSTIIIHLRTPSRANSDKLYFLHLLISLSLYMLAVTMYKGATFDKTFNAAIQCREHHTFWESVSKWSWLNSFCVGISQFSYFDI